MLQGAMFLAWAWLRDDIRGPRLGGQGKEDIVFRMESFVCIYNVCQKRVCDM